jgi:diguanylate cyclase (GGDEF)-like protein/PAS domain S-box-containing protein
MEFAAMREVMASLYDQTPDATILCDRRDRVVNANSAAQRLTGCAAGELVGRSCAKLATPSDRLEQALQRAYAGEVVHCEIELLSSSGSNAATECEVVPARLGDEVVGAFVIVRATGAVLHDTLTGLPSRALLEDRIEQSLVTARRYNYRFAIVCANVDGFSQILARCGPGPGDEVLRTVARRIRETLRRSDTVARAGVDEFVVLQPMLENAEDAVDLVHKIIFAMSAPIVAGTHTLDVRLSLGIAIFPENGESQQALTAAASGAMREAKRHSPGLFCLATSLEKERVR